MTGWLPRELRELPLLMVIACPLWLLIILLLGGLIPVPWGVPFWSALPTDLISGLELLNFLFKLGAPKLFLVGVVCWVFPLRVLVGVGFGVELIRWRVFRWGVVGVLSVDRLDSEGDFLIGVVGYNKSTIILITMLITHCFATWSGTSGCGWFRGGKRGSLQWLWLANKTVHRNIQYW